MIAYSIVTKDGIVFQEFPNGISVISAEQLIKQLIQSNPWLADYELHPEPKKD
jgi:hypothetical protein